VYVLTAVVIFRPASGMPSLEGPIGAHFVGWVKNEQHYIWYSDENCPPGNQQEGITSTEPGHDLADNGRNTDRTQIRPGKSQTKRQPPPLLEPVAQNDLGRSE
jgi:hypothetical protein